MNTKLSSVAIIAIAVLIVTTTAQAQTMHDYIVQDSALDAGGISALVLACGGTLADWPTYAAASGLPNPELIRIGQTIKLPCADPRSFSSGADLAHITFLEDEIGRLMQEINFLSAGSSATAREYVEQVVYLDSQLGIKDAEIAGLKKELGMLHRSKPEMVLAGLAGLALAAFLLARLTRDGNINELKRELATGLRESREKVDRFRAERDGALSALGILGLDAEAWKISPGVYFQGDSLRREMMVPVRRDGKHVMVLTPCGEVRIGRLERHCTEGNCGAGCWERFGKLLTLTNQRREEPTPDSSVVESFPVRREEATVT